jgi:hypothetical protein
MLASAALLALVLAAGCTEQIGQQGNEPPEAATPADESAPKAQTKCPITGRPIDKTLFVEAEGYRIYVCCPACIDKVQGDPRAAAARIRDNGEEPEKLAR